MSFARSVTILMIMHHSEGLKVSPNIRRRNSLAHMGVEQRYFTAELAFM